MWSLYLGIEGELRTGEEFREMPVLAKATQATADAAHSRIAALHDYETVGNITVHFKVGSAVLSDDARRSLDGLAHQARNLKGYVIEVAGFASSEGDPVFNQRLSRRWAEAVSEYLAEQQDVPLLRIITPTGYGVTHPVSDNSTRAGGQENRRVEIRLLVSCGITADAGTSRPASDANERAGVRSDHPRWDAIGGFVFRRRIRAPLRIRGDFSNPEFTLLLRRLPTIALGRSPNSV
jgi:outer membrane protein OmpA-like peptidoglycan-associated protein